VTEDRMRSRYDELIERAADEDEREFWRSIRRAEPENMTIVLGHLRDRYGSVAEYLRGGGFTDAQQKALVDRLITL
jgi:Tyrosine phosphatase family